MGNNYSNHTRIVFTNYNDIQVAINDGRIDVNDIVICKDSHELIIIKDDLSMLPIKSKTYRFQSVEEAVEKLNEMSDTYAGQLVAIMGDGVYHGYLVNIGEDGNYIVSKLGSSDVDYDEITNVPIKNIYGKVFEPVIVSTLKDGFYRINGNYKIYENEETVYSSMNGNLFIIETVDEVQKIKRITASDISDYYIEGDVIHKDVIATEKFLEEQGYVKEAYIDSKLETLNLVTKEEAHEFIAAAMDEEIKKMINTSVRQTIDEMFAPANDTAIEDMFA